MKKLISLLITTSLVIAGSYNFSQAEEWEEKASFPGDERDHPVGWGLGDYGYILTGLGDGVVYRDFYKYDPVEDEWDQLALFPGSARGFSIGIEYDGKGYIGFGTTPAGETNDLWEYDPETETWDEKTPCPCAGRRHPVLEAANGMIFAGLGDTIDQGIVDLNDWWGYDIETDTWQELAPLPAAPRHHPYHFTIDGYVYAGMGHSGQSIYDDWYRYDPAEDEWEQMSDFPGEGRVAGTQFAYNGKGYVLSGDGSDHSYMDDGEFWEYDPETDTWEELPPHPGVSRWAPTSFVVNDEVFFFGGLDRQADVKPVDVWAFELPLHVTTIAPANGATDISLETYMEWTDHSRADSYHVQITEEGDPDFNNTVFDTDTLSSYMHTLEDGILDEGTIYIWRVRAGNQDGWGDWSATSTFTTEGDIGNLLSSEHLSGDFRIYPNPASDLIQAEVSLTGAEKPEIKLLTLQGKEISTNPEHKEKSPGSYSFTIPVNHLQQGMYLLQFNTVNGTHLEKIIVN